MPRSIEANPEVLCCKMAATETIGTPSTRALVTYSCALIPKWALPDATTARTLVSIPGAITLTSRPAS